MKPYQSASQQEVGTLGLSVALAEDKLTVTLRDYVKQVVYSRDYTKDDIGGEIDSRVSLTDIWTALSQPTTDDKANRLQHHEVGSVVKRGGSPSFKIGKGGRVTVFHTAIEESTKEQTTYESNLTLTKANDITEIEKATQAEVRDNNNFDQIHLKNRQLQKRVANLEEENKTIKAKFDSLRSDLVKNINQMSQRLSTAKQTIGKYQYQLRQKRNQIQIQYREIQAQNIKIAQLSKQLSNQSSKVSDLQKQLSDRSDELSKQLQILNQHSQQLAGSTERMAKTELEIKPIRQAMSIHSLGQATRHDFSIDGLRVRLINPSGSWTQYMFNKPIYANQSYKFYLKVVQSWGYETAIGVVDYLKQKDQRYSFSSGNGNYLCYVGDTAYKYPQGSKEGDGFKHNDLVEVEVNRKACTVKYRVNNVLKATSTNQILADSSRIFVPYFQTKTGNDAVQWVIY